MKKYSKEFSFHFYLVHIVLVSYFVDLHLAVIYSFGSPYAAIASFVISDKFAL